MVTGVNEEWKDVGQGVSGKYVLRAKKRLTAVNRVAFREGGVKYNHPLFGVLPTPWSLDPKCSKQAPRDAEFLAIASTVLEL